MRRSGIQEFLGGFRSSDCGERQELFAAYDGDRMVGNAVLWSFLLDNTDKAWFDVDVDVPERRRGIGRALVERLEETVEDDGRALVMTDTKLPFDDRESHAYRRFAEACGYELSNYEVVRHLALPVPDARIQEWIDEAAPHHEGYTIETFVGAVPDDLVESLCVLLGQLAVDAPTGAVDFEEEAMTPQRYAEMLRPRRRDGPGPYETVALTPERQVVAQSTLSVPLGESTRSTSGALRAPRAPRPQARPRHQGGQPPSRPGRPRRPRPWSPPRTPRPTATWSPSTSGWASGRSRSRPSSSSSSDHRGREVQAGDQLGQQGAHARVEVGDDPADGRVVLALRVVDRPVDVPDARDVRALLAAAQGDGEVAGGDHVAGQGLGRLARGVEAEASRTRATSGWICSPGSVPAERATTRSPA